MEKVRREFWASLENWWQKYQRQYPWRRDGISPFDILIAEVLLKRTTAAAASRLYLSFLEQHPNPDAIRRADEASLQLALRPIGLSKQRARSLKEICEYLCRETKGVIPSSLDTLQAIPHIGPYSSRAILSFGYGIPAAVVDSNVSRIINRVFGVIKAKHKQMQETADQLVPHSRHREFNWAMLDLGALVCRYVQPRCNWCPVKELCRHDGHPCADDIGEAEGA